MPSSVASDYSQEVSGVIIDLDELQAHGIGATDIAKLKAHGYYTVSDVQGTTRKKLTMVKGFSEVKVDKVKEAIVKCMPGPVGGFITASELKQQRKKLHIISTGSKQLDSALGGGIRSLSSTEVFGEYRCGKTQMAQTLCVMAQLPKSMGGAEGKAAYIDTEGTFRPERVEEISKRFGLDPDQVMENILYARAYNSEHQNELLFTLSQQLVSGEFRLLVVDSLMAHFRVDYSGRGELQERQHKLAQLMAKMNHIADTFNVAVFCTNQVQSDPGASALFAGVDGRKAVGGHVVAHASQTRILLRKGRGDERVAKIVDSPDVAEKEATYIITSGGINDPEKA